MTDNSRRLEIHPTYRYPNGLQQGLPLGLGDEPGLPPLGRWLVRVFFALVLLTVVLVLSWLASNWQDVPPQPRPAELALPQPRLAPVRNAYFALAGLRAAADRDPAKVGRDLWAAELKLAQQLQTPLTNQQRDALLTGRAGSAAQALGAPPLAVAQGAPWDCDELGQECVAQYLAQADALTRQRQAMAALGARCDALLDSVSADKPLAYEEMLLVEAGPALAAPGEWSNATACGRWFRTGAVLAFRQGRKDEAWRLMARSNLLHRALLGGAHSLIAHSVLQGMGRRNLNTVSSLAAADPAWVQQALPLTASFGAPEQLARRWIVTESAVAYGAVREISQRAADANSGDAAAQSGSSLSAGERLVDGMQNALMARRIGWLPEHTLQLQDQHWLALLRRVDAGLPTLLQPDASGNVALTAGSSPASPWRWWRNTLGRAVVDAVPLEQAMADYLRKQLDLELHREAAALALNAQRLGLAPAARAAWMQQQSTSPALRERGSWSADGRTLNVRPWASDGRPADQAAPARDRIQITLDRTALG